MQEQKTTVEIPVGFIEDRTGYCLFNTDETKNIIGDFVGIVVQKDTLEEAKKEFLLILKYHLEWIEGRSRELDKWKLFQKGDWKHRGGSWFSVLGFHFYFRKGKGMRGGRYIPFTRMNISFHNYWKKRKTKI